MGFLDRKNDDEALVDRESIAVVPIIAESLTVHKTIADSGGIRIHKSIHKETVTVDEPLLRQSVQVTRTPVGREVEAPMPIRYEGDATIIPIIEERLITRRQLFLVEEVRLTRIDQTDRLPQEITLRHEEAVIERQDMVSGTWIVEPKPAAATAPESAEASHADPATPKRRTL